MMIGLIVVLLVARVGCERHSVHYQRQVSRRSRSNTAPYETEYIYSQVNSGPSTLEVYGDSGGVGGFNTIPVNGPSLRHAARASIDSEYHNSYKDEQSGDQLQLKPIDVYNRNLLQKLKDQPDYEHSNFISYDVPDKNNEFYPLKYTDYKKPQPKDVSTEKFQNINDQVARINMPQKGSSKIIFTNHSYKNLQESKLSSPVIKENTVLVENHDKNISLPDSYSDVQPTIRGKLVKGDILLDNYDNWPSLTHKDEYKSTNFSSNVFTVPVNMSNSYSHSPLSYHKPDEHSIDHARQKAEAKLNINYMPSKLDTDALYERLKTLMHYTPPITGSFSDSPYHSMNDYHMDDNDIRSGMSSSYDSSPYIFKNAYELEHSRADYEMQRSKDKRYAMDKERDHIPVHELMHDYEPESLHAATTPENPNHGNQPFFSFVLNDYYQKNDEDPVQFKGMDTWVDDFDYEAKLDENLKKHEEPQIEPYLTTNAAPIYHKPHYNAYEKILHSNRGDSASDNGYTKNHEYQNEKKGNDIKLDHHSGYKHDGKKYKGFKDFIDTFVNKFGKENVKKDAKYKLHHNQDKGEKKKGFRKVYHKDEYQEEDEFYDHNNKSANGEESGSLAAHNNAVEAYLKSHSGANLHELADEYNKAGNIHKNEYEKNRSGHGTRKESDSQFHKYRDEAKKVAHRNNDFHI